MGKITDKLTKDDLTIRKLEFYGPNKENEGVLRIYWGQSQTYEGFLGYGAMDFILKNGKLQVETEYMCKGEDKRFIELLLQLITDQCEVIE